MYIGEIRAYDARLNKPNDRTLFHGEIEDCESLVFVIIIIIQRIDTLPKYGKKTLDVPRST